MRCHRFSAILAAVLIVPGAVLAQQQGPGLPSPRLLVLTPPGGKVGTTLEMTVTGQDLEEPQALVFSHPGLKAELVSETTPPPDPKKTTQGKQNNQGLTSHRFKVAVAADTPLGNHDVRLVNKLGISNPRTFVVGDLPEILEKEPNNDVKQAQPVELNTTVNGTISTPTDVDYYVFGGQKGQRVVLSCLASSIDSRLPAALQLFSSTGSLLAFNRNYQGNDALLDCTLPADGDYQVRVFAFTYTQGNDEYFYRLTISTAPWIDAVYPPVVEPGKTARLTVYGRNLPGGETDPSAVVDGRVLEKATVTVDVPKEPGALQGLAYRGLVPPHQSGLDGFEYRLHNETGSSNAWMLTFARAPVVLDNEANDTPETAQEVPVPCAIAGRIEKRRDRDWYTFSARKGDVYSIEAFGDRLGSPLDLYFVLRTGDGKQTLADLDDNPEVLNPLQFLTRSEDPPRFKLTVPANGKYQLMVSSREAYVQAGPRHLYTVRITPEQPDFRLVVMPQSFNTPEACVVHRGGRQYCMVYVWRQDGFDGDITLTAGGLPEGVTCPPQTVGRQQRETTLVFSAADNAPHWTGPIHVKCTATINGRAVEREARSASVTWPVQQNVTAISRLDQELVLAVRDEAPFTLTAGLDKVTATQGEKVEVPLKLQRHWADLKGPVQINILNLPQSQRGNNAVVTTLNPGKVDARVTLDVKNNVPPGTYTIVLRGQTQLAYMKDTKKKQRQNLTIVQPSSPILLTVLPKQVAQVTLRPSNPTVKQGKDADITVKVTRLYDFDGEFKVQLVDQGTKGVHAEEVTIPAGKDEATLVLQTDGSGGPGNRSLIVRATATVHEKPIAQEAKINVNVVK